MYDMRKPRSQAYNRDVSIRKALRKRRIAREVYYDGDTHPYYSNLHQYSKIKFIVVVLCVRLRYAIKASVGICMETTLPVSITALANSASSGVWMLTNGIISSLDI